jgi:Mor family transcriptional regulator
MKGSFTEQLIELVGIEATRKLVERWRGVHLYFPDPEFLTDDHPLVECVGRDEAEALCKEYQGYWLLMPTGYAEILAERNRQICQARAAGATIAQLVVQFRLCERTIYYVLAQEADTPATLHPASEQPQPTQLGLFSPAGQ